jgi:DNA invertase Pin-like site-specific DNA recombinase
VPDLLVDIHEDLEDVSKEGEERAGDDRSGPCRPDESDDVLVNPGDTSTPAGRLMRTVLAAVADFERDTISERTKIGLAEARRKGVRLGKGPSIPAEVRARIAALRAEGLGARRIANVLNEEGVATVKGGPWNVGTIQRVIGQR